MTGHTVIDTKICEEITREEESKKSLEKERLTCNQLILLLEYFRGTENNSVVMGTRGIDLLYLAELGLLESTAAPLWSFRCTQKAHDYIGRIQNL